MSSEPDPAPASASEAAGGAAATVAAGPLTAPGRPARDLGALMGLALAFGLLGLSVAMGGSLLSYFDLPSVIIVGAGTIAITAASHGFAATWATFRLVARALAGGLPDAPEVGLHALRLAVRARRDGALSLQTALPRLRSLPFLQRAVHLVVDGVPAEEVERAMRLEQQARALRHTESTGVLRRAAEVAPAMGLIGTLVGLVQMLAHLDDPSRIGPGMAVALLTTFYGAVLANMVLLPLAAKLELRARAETLISEISMLAATSIARQENPRRLETLINTLLPPSRRIVFFSE